MTANLAANSGASLAASHADHHTNGSVVAIGKFEGVHRGHQQIIESLLKAAKRDGLTSVVLTFANNPLSVLQPEACPDPLMSPAQRKEALQARGVQEVFMIPFTVEFAEVSAERFITDYLVAELNAKHVIVGDDFRFGKGAEGTPELLRQAGLNHGFTVEVIAEVIAQVQDSHIGRISSTAIREAVQAGDVQLAAELLGHPHAVRGVVVHGEARGRELGVPTANVGPATTGPSNASPATTANTANTATKTPNDSMQSNNAREQATIEQATIEQPTLEGMIPADGVYAGWVKIDGGAPQMAAISVGVNPTFTPTSKSQVEAHILDFAGDLYGKNIEVLFTHRVRGMQAFASVDELISRMMQDIADVRDFLS